MKKPRGYFTAMDDKGLLDYFAQNHQGETITRVQRSDNRAYTLAYQRGLLDDLVEKRILVMASRKSAFSRMDDDKVAGLVRQKYDGKTVGELMKQDHSLYQILRRRRLMPKLLQDGTLSGKRNVRDMTDEQIMQHLRKNSKGQTTTECYKNSGRIYTKALQRGLVDKLVAEGTLRKLNRRGEFKDLTDEQFIIYVDRNYHGISLGEVKRRDPSIYFMTLQRKLVNRIVDQGVLVRILPRRANTEDLEKILVGYVRS